MRAIRPTGARCQSEIAAVELRTLESLSQVRGKLGRVVYSRENLDSRPELLERANGFRSVDTQFYAADGIYGPSDIQTLLAVSLYYAVETGYQLMSSLDASADVLGIEPTFSSKTFIVLDARRSNDLQGGTISDNAEYLPQPIPGGGFYNYLLSYPTRDAGDRGLGLNLGVMVHEYTHLVFNYLFYEKMASRGVTMVRSVASDNALGSIDEGLADYFGFLATKDPGFFLCTFPTEDRDLAKVKSQTAQLRMRLQGDASFDIHEGGALFASINYEIGQAIGSHEENGRMLIRLMSNLLDCGDARASGSTGSLNLTLESVGRCHAGLAGSHSATVQRIYDTRLNPPGGGT